MGCGYEYEATSAVFRAGGFRFLTGKAPLPQVEFARCCMEKCRQAAYMLM
jgi:hypothetical protein